MNTKKTSFSAVVKLPERYDSEEVTIDIELSKDEEHLTYDEVVDAVLDKVDELYKYDGNDEDLYEDLDDDCYPHIVDLVINADDGEYYPVISESMDDSKLKASKEVAKYLILPDAVYSITPEAKLWLELKEEGLVDVDMPFDFDKYHKIIEKRGF